MPFYLRKSISAGPFRFNFSKGGVGASIGVRGLRIGTGPRGHYVHAGRGGVYYRATLGRAGERDAVRMPTAPTTQPPAEAWNVEMVEVESGDVLAMRDETFGEIIDEINAKRAQPRMAPLLGWGLALAGVLIAVIGGWAWAPFVLVGLAGWSVGRWLDSYRRTCVLFYDLDPDAQRAYERVIAAFDRLAGCAGRWHVEAGGAVRDLTTWKRNAGATHIVRKQPTTLGYAIPAAISCNLTPPSLHVGKQILYFLPDVALIDDGGQVGAVGYAALEVAWQDSNFIEEGPVPQDAQVIGHTWKHPNKNGGPDRRFRDNRQIPICRYEVMHLHSASGVNELVEFSRVGLCAGLADALAMLPNNPTLTKPAALPRPLARPF